MSYRNFLPHDFNRGQFFNLLTETSNLSHGTILLSFLVSRLQKPSSLGLESRQSKQLCRSAVHLLFFISELYYHLYQGLTPAHFFIVLIFLKSLPGFKAYISVPSLVQISISVLSL
jgi:hypothetical protein